MKQVETRVLSPIEIAFRERVKMAFLAEAKVENAEEGFIIAPSVNQEIDPELQSSVARMIATRFEGTHIDKVFGIPTSGLHLGTAVAAEILGVKELTPRKGVEVPSSWNQKVFSTEARSFSLNVKSSIKYSFVKPGEKVLVVDDFIAWGETACNVIGSLRDQAHVEVVGFAAWVSKEFQGGLARVEREFNIPTFAAITVKEIGPNNEIILKEDI